MSSLHTEKILPLQWTGRVDCCLRLGVSYSRSESYRAFFLIWLFFLRAVAFPSSTILFLIICINWTSIIHETPCNWNAAYYPIMWLLTFLMIIPISYSTIFLNLIKSKFQKLGATSVGSGSSTPPFTRLSHLGLISLISFAFI